jgi:hypothetical protein
MNKSAATTLARLSRRVHLGDCRTFFIVLTLTVYRITSWLWLRASSALSWAVRSRRTPRAM